QCICTYHLYLLLVHHGYKEIGREKQERPVKPRLGYTDDGERMLVQLDDTAYNATIILKTTVPKRVREHHVRSAVRAMLIRRVNEPAEMRLNPQNVEVVSAHFINPGGGGILAGI